MEPIVKFGLAALIYLAIAAFNIGFFLAVNEDVPDKERLALLPLIGGLFWPITWLAIFGVKFCMKNRNH